MCSTAALEASLKDRKFWLELIHAYKCLPVLWDRDEKSYNERRKRNVAYEELVKLARIVFPNADATFVKTRLIAFRTCYKRELKKVRAAKANGTTYEPSLFYFNAMRFLDPDDDDCEDFNDHWDNSMLDDDDPFYSPKPTNNTEPEAEPESHEPEIELGKVKRKYKRKCQPSQVYQLKVDEEEEEERFNDFDETDNNSEKLVCTRPKRSKYNDDEYTLFGERIASHLRKMDEEQSLIAEKIISETCINGRLKSLTMRSYVKIVPTLSQDSTIMHQTIERKSSIRKDDVYDDDIDF